MNGRSPTDKSSVGMLRAEAKVLQNSGQKYPGGALGALVVQHILY